MKETVKNGCILSLICMLAGGSLALVYSLTSPRILAKVQAAEEESLKEVLPEAATFETVKKNDAILYYRALDEKGKLIGVAFRASGKGYSSVIETMVGMLTDGTITAIKILSQNETPGVGTRVTEGTFQGQFRDLPENRLAEVQGITGATISSQAVIRSIQAKADEIKALLKNE